MQLQPSLAKSFRILSVLVMLVVILVYAKPFLVPLTFAAILSMLLLPIVKWFSQKGLPEVVSILLAILLFIALFVALGFFIGWQVSGIAEDSDKMERELTEKVQQLKAFISHNFGVSPQKQKQIVTQQQEAAPGKGSAIITGLLAGLGTFVTHALLVLVYVFILLFYRGHLKASVLKFVPPARQAEAKKIMHDAQQINQKYLTGLALMIVCLWVLYGIGFSIVGVQNALFFAVLCGVLEIVPFVGNLAGTLLTVGMALVQGGSGAMLLGILITYGAVQFIQSYIIEPLVVGAEVNINPLFTIAGIVAGELVWGIPGMILSIPLMGMLKIICDGVPVLKPVGFLMGSGKKKESKSLPQKIKGWFR